MCSSSGFCFAFSLIFHFSTVLGSLKILLERRYQQQSTLSFWQRWSRSFHSMPAAWGFLVAWIAIFLSTSIHWKILQDGAIGKEKKGRNFRKGRNFQNYRGIGGPTIIIEADVRRGKGLS